MTPQVGNIVANRFELIRQLGGGSMGTVWLAHHLSLDVRCAVKFMTRNATQDPNYSARFEFEARTVARLTSPNVVRVIDYAVHEGLPFIAMECLQGEDLGVRLQRLGRLDAATTYRIISEVAHGLAKAHAAGIIHRDLKPDNIFLAQEDDKEIAKIVDFGIAKMTGFAAEAGLTDTTQAGSLLGTPAYMSPEQARGGTDLDHRSDLWSLAIIAFECLTGRLPFEGDSLGDLFAQILCEPIPVPSKVDPPTASRSFDRWWARAVSRAPAERFSTATELADALGRALGIVEIAPEIRTGAWAFAWDGQEARALRLRLPKRMSKVVVVALAVSVAPIALMISSRRIDARPPQTTAPSAVAARPSSPPVPASALPPAASAPGEAAAQRPSAGEFQTPKHGSAPAPSTSPSPHAARVRVRSRGTHPATSNDDVDFGI